MDKCTHEVRKQHWIDIIQQCMQRPEGISIKQWCENNGICEQTYYVWQKRIRQEAYNLAATSSNTSVTLENEVTFAEVKVPSSSNVIVEDSFQVAMTIQTGSAMIGISNEISETLLTKVLEVITNA